MAHAVERVGQVAGHTDPVRQLHRRPAGAADHIRRDTRHADWTIAYQSLGDIQKADAAENGKVANPKDSKVWRKIVRLSGTVEDLNPPAGNKAAWVNDAKVKTGKQAVLLRSAEGLTTMLYVDPRTAALQPGG